MAARQTQDEDDGDDGLADVPTMLNELKRAWVSEKACPDLLPYHEKAVAAVLAAVEEQVCLATDL